MRRISRFLGGGSRNAIVTALPNLYKSSVAWVGGQPDNEVMDIASIIGLVLGFGSIIVAAEVSHANMALFYEKYEAFVLVFGGTLGAAFLSFPLKTCVDSLKEGFTIMLFAPKERSTQLVDEFARYADIARRDGLLVLEHQLVKMEDPSIRRAIEMIIDGQSVDVIRGVLETETDLTVARMHDTEAFFGALGGYSPTLGIIGTVLGLIAMLGKLGALTESGNIAGSIGGETAAAFIATFLGVFFANLLWLPIGGKVKARIAHVELERELITEGVLMIAAGCSRTVVRQRLQAYLALPSIGPAKIGEETQGEARSSTAASPQTT
jgi:chemotaxis protein MotA